jgi:hypothetical protein
MKLVVSFRMGVLHRDLRAEFNMGSDGRTELFVGGKFRRVERSHVQLDKPLPLLLGDPKASVHVDEMCEAELSREAVGPAERLGGEGRQVIDVFRLASPEERLEEGILEDAAVERVLEAVQRRLAPDEFVQRRHGSIVRSGSRFDALKAYASSTQVARDGVVDPDQVLADQGGLGVRRYGIGDA